MADLGQGPPGYLVITYLDRSHSVTAALLVVEWLNNWIREVLRGETLEVYVRQEDKGVGVAVRFASNSGEEANFGLLVEHEGVKLARHRMGDDYAEQLGEVLTRDARAEYIARFGT